MKSVRIIFAIFTVACFTGSAAAQIIGMGTTSRGGTAQIATAIAKVISARTDVRMRTQPMAGTAKYIPEVNGNVARDTFAQSKRAALCQGGCTRTSTTNHHEDSAHPCHNIARRMLIPIRVDPP